MINHFNEIVSRPSIGEEFYCNVYNDIAKPNLHWHWIMLLDKRNYSNTALSALTFTAGSMFRVWFLGPKFGR